MIATISKATLIFVSAFTDGQYVEINLPGTEYHKCIGVFRFQQEGYTAISQVSCPNGSSYDYIVGIREKDIKPLSSNRR
jgi:hypothetical protein